MYGPSSAPGMRTRHVSIFKYFFKNKGAGGSAAELWEPADNDELNGESEGGPSALASEILPPILQLIPRLKSSDANDAAQAASEMVSLTNNTSTDEDAVVGRSGALEVLGQVLCKGNEEGKTAAASAIANLIANADANKLLVSNLPGVLGAFVSLAASSHDKPSAVAARALLNLVSNKDCALALARTHGAIDALAHLVLTAKMETKEDAARVLNTMVDKEKEVCVLVAKVDSAMQALKAVARTANSTGEAKLWAVSALHGLSRCSRVRQTLLRAKIVEDVCVPLVSHEALGEWHEAIQALATMTAANLTGWHDASPLIEHKAKVAGLVHVMAMALTCREHGRYRFRNSHVLQALWSVSANDAFKADLVAAKLLELSIDMIALAHTQGHRGMNLVMLLEMIYQICFSEQGAARLKELQGIKMLEAHARGPDPLVRRLARGTLWTLGVRETLTQPSPAEAGKHIYFSFHKDDEEWVKTIANALHVRGYAVLLNGEKQKTKEGKRPSHLAAMANAISCAAHVVVCISDKYNTSPFCRTEAEYIAECQAQVVPILLDDSKPAKHLQSVASTLDCIDAAERSALELIVLEMTEELGESGKRDGRTQPSTPATPQSLPPTIAFTDLKGGNSTRFPAPEVDAQDGPALPSGAGGWGGYEAAFMRGGEGETGGGAGSEQGAWEEEHDSFLGGGASLEGLATLVRQIVKERTSKLEARVQTLEAEARELRTETASLRAMVEQAHKTQGGEKGWNGVGEEVEVVEVAAGDQHGKGQGEGESQVDEKGVAGSDKATKGDPAERGGEREVGREADETVARGEGGGVLGVKEEGTGRDPARTPTEGGGREEHDGGSDEQEQGSGEGGSQKRMTASVGSGGFDGSSEVSAEIVHADEETT